MHRRIGWTLVAALRHTFKLIGPEIWNDIFSGPPISRFVFSKKPAMSGFKTRCLFSPHDLAGFLPARKLTGYSRKVRGRPALAGF